MPRSGSIPLDAQIRQVFFFDTPDLRCTTERHRRARAADPGQERRLGGEAPSGRAGRAPGGRPRSASHQRRGRRDAGRVRLLGVDEGEDRERRTCSTPWRLARRCARSSRRSSARSSPSMHRKGSSSTSCGSSARPSCSRRSSRRRELGRRLVAELWLLPDGSRILELSTKSPPDRSVPGRVRIASVPGRPGARPQRRAAAEDEVRSRLLRGRAAERGRARLDPARRRLREAPGAARRVLLQDPAADDHAVHLVRAVVDAAAAGHRRASSRAASGR